MFTLSFIFIYMVSALPATLRSVMCTVVAVAAVYMPMVHAETVTAAVAANFVKPLEAVKPHFEQATGHTLVISGGSTGQLYTQIRNGAPYDVMLSADEERPRLLEQEGPGVAGTRFTYAIGKLVLWAPAVPSIAQDATMVLEKKEYRALALANPALAPYGMAARQALEKLGLWDKVQDKVVLGQDIGQTFSLVHTGNAQLGFVALSQLLNTGIDKAGNHWEIPAGLHAPILQQAILLERGKYNPAAEAFINFLRDETVRRIITEFGYGTE
jgi:molybdate transport system substrate-binding protein